MSDELIGDRGTAHPATASRGRRGEPAPGDVVRQYARENAPADAQLRSWFGLDPPATPAEPVDLHLRFFEDLLAISGSSPIDPLSSNRARAIEERWGMRPPYVRDPKTAEQWLTGFEVVLTLAAFYPPLTPAAGGVLLVLGVMRAGSTGELAVAVIPFHRIAQGAKVIRALLKLGRAFQPARVSDYQAVARLLLRRDPQLATVAKRLVQVRNAAERKAVDAAIAAYRAEKLATGNARAAAQAAGDAFHKTIGAAGAGEGADILRKAGVLIEVKTHYAPIVDELVLQGGQAQVVGYVLKEIVERGAVHQGRVLHFFIDPTTGKAVKLAVDPMHGEHILDALTRIGTKR